MNMNRNISGRQGLFIAAIVIVAIIWIAQSHHSSSSPKAATSTTSNTAPVAQIATVSPAEDLTPVDTTPAVTKWVKVATFSGTTDNNSTAFLLKGGEQKVTWTLHAASNVPSGMVGAAIGIAGVKSDQIGDAIEGSGVGGGWKREHLDAGRYYFEMVAGNCSSWHLAIYEKRQAQ